MVMKKKQFWKFAILFLTMAPLNVYAHARLKSALPIPNSVVLASDSPTKISLTFSEDIEAAFSKIQVRANLVQGPVVPEIKDAKVSQVPDKKNVLEVQLTSALKPGRYFVVWKVTSVDTHKSNGNYAFTIK